MTPDMLSGSVPILCENSYNHHFIRIRIHPNTQSHIRKLIHRTLILISILTLCLIQPVMALPNDYDENGYVDYRDYVYISACFNGPQQSPHPNCAVIADFDIDGDVDLADFAQFTRTLGHLSIPLKDYQDRDIRVDSTQPYSGRHTCGGCHDLNVIANGLHFQQGRTDVAGNIAMQNDIFGDGRDWERSRGRYGRWSQVAAQELAAKNNNNESEIDVTTFGWINGGIFSICGGCHAGGGPGEFDRDGQLLYNDSTGQFGYELLGKTANDVLYDGDYSFVDPNTGDWSLAPWDVTGISGPDCLLCHRADRTNVNGSDINQTWRMSTLAAGTNLVDDQGQSVPAFAAAGTAGQGWFSNLQTEGRATSVLQIDYAYGILDGSLTTDHSGNLSLTPSSITSTITDPVCVSCHLQTIILAGKWYDEDLVHYAKFNNLSDDDPNNDIPPDKSTTCNYCHPGGVDHNFAKGNNIDRMWRDELDWNEFRSCRECHLEDSPVRHADAPMVPGNVPVHLVEPFEIISCQGCHVPYTKQIPWFIFADATVTGYPGRGPGATYYSSDPLNPSDPDKTKWYPGFQVKTDSDGIERLFPIGIMPQIYWADWNQNGTPSDLTDDTLKPIITWRIRQLTGGVALAIVTDDNADGILEINRPQEITAYIELLKGNDPYGRPVATNPVLVKGKHIWYEDAQSPEGVQSFDYTQTGIINPWESYIWGADHDVIAASQAWGAAENPADGCRDCHRPETYDSPVFDRLVLTDPYGPDGKPIYETVRSMTGLNPP